MLLASTKPKTNYRFFDHSQGLQRSTVFNLCTCRPCAEGYLLYICLLQAYIYEQQPAGTEMPSHRVHILYSPLAPFLKATLIAAVDTWPELSSGSHKMFETADDRRIHNSSNFRYALTCISITSL
jgi:hypothetical protein